MCEQGQHSTEFAKEGGLALGRMHDFQIFSQITSIYPELDAVPDAWFSHYFAMWSTNSSGQFTLGRGGQKSTTTVYDVGGGAKSVVKMQAVASNRFILLDDEPRVEAKDKASGSNMEDPKTGPEEVPETPQPTDDGMDI